MKPTSLFRKPNTAQNRCLPCLIKNRNWNKATKALDERHEDNNLSTCICHKRCEDHLKYPSLLHFACKFYPSLLFIKAYISADCNSLSRMDSLSQYPLHIACKYGAKPRVLRYLIEQYPQAASLRDADGNSTLHLIFWGSSIEEDAFSPLYESKFLMEKIAILCQAVPTLVTIQNHKGNTALDEELERGIDISVMYLLHSLSTLEEQGRSSVAWLKEIETTGEVFKTSKMGQIIPL